MFRTKNPGDSKHPAWGFRLGVALIVFLLAGAALWCRWVYMQIERFATHDQAALADAICVFGAAEYNGRPSPVFRARLDHALDLYRRGMAPILITLGGPGGDQYNEGTVGQSYLVGRGVPEHDIIAETHSSDTEESAAQIAVIARANHLRRLIIVSDGTHLFRIRALCAAEGLDVLTSPRPKGAVDNPSQQFQRVMHEIVSYTLWKIGLH